MNRWMQLGTAAVIAGLVACGSDVSTPSDPLGVKSLGPGGTDSSSGGGQSGPTSNGPVASVTLSPHALFVNTGSYVGLVATAKDAAGVRVVKQVSWRSSDPSIVTVTDTGVVFAKAVGNAKIFATVDGFADSAQVTVAQGPPSTLPPTVAEFNLKIVAFGALPGADTSRTERVSGVTVTLERRGGVTGDTLATPEPAGTAVTNANGEVSFSKLKGGTYSFVLTPPAGSGFVQTQGGIAPPRQSDISAFVTLRRQ